MSWICEALGVSRSGFHAWLVRAPSKRALSDEAFGARVRASFISSYRTYGARRVWHDLLAEGISCGLHRIERLMRVHGLRARPRRRGLPIGPAAAQPDRVPVRMAPQITSQLHADLVRYASLYKEAYGHEEAIADLSIDVDGIPGE